MYTNKNIKYLRTKKKWSQSEFGDYFGLNRGKIQSYEGKSEPPLSVISSIADYFNVSIDDLINIDLSKIKDEDMNIKIEGHNNVIGKDIKIKHNNQSPSLPEQNTSANEIEILRKEVLMLKDIIASKDEIISLLKDKLSK